MDAPPLGLGMAECLRRLAATRDAGAWACVVEDLGGTLYRTCRRILGDEACAEDAVQETLLQVRDRAGRFRAPEAHPDAAARAWILRLAVNTALQMLRRRSREDRHVERRAMERSAESSNAGGADEAQAERSERLEAVNRALPHLPEAERLPLLLHYYAGLDYAALAEALGCPVNTAKTRVHRGIERLRERLAALGLLLPVADLDRLLEGPGVQDGAAVLSTAQAQRLRGLLESNRCPALDGRALNEGVRTMTKIACAGLVVLLAAVLWTTQGNGADAPSPSQANAEEPPVPPAAPTVPEEPLAGTRAPVVPEKLSAPPADPNKPATKEEKAQAVADLNASALEIYRAASKDDKGNVFLSPYSISTALAMTYLGARGDTAAEMEKALHFTQRERVHAAYAALIEEMNDAGADPAKRPYALTVANRLFGQKGYPFEAAFLKDSAAFYGSGLAETDFKDRPAACKQINTWVEQQTHDKIKDLLALENLMLETRLVLVNTIYFKSDWANPFEKIWTQEEPFRLASGSKVTAPLMRATEQFDYLEDGGRLQVLELPYKNRALSMFVILPTAHDGLPGIEAALTAEEFSRWAKDAKSQRVSVVLPRFKTTWHKSLKSPLQALGMKLAFELGKPDFTAIAKVPGEPLFVGDVIHKAFVDVDEAGTEAAAATAVVMNPGSMPPADPPKQFRADRPFLYAIRHNASGAILFLGRVMDPTKE